MLRRDPRDLELPRPGSTPRVGLEVIGVMLLLAGALMFLGAVKAGADAALGFAIVLVTGGLVAFLVGRPTADAS